MELKSKVAVVTGGGRGIGRGITEKFLNAGANVLVAQRQPLDNDLSRNQKVAWVQSDLTRRTAPYSIARVVEETFGSVDILVNNAGFMFEKSLEEMCEADWDQMMIVNMRAPVFLAKALLPQMRRGGGGNIINIGSIEGLGANSWHSAYCSSKAGIHGLTRALAIDLGRESIRCNAIAPGWINTELSQAYVQAQVDPERAYKALTDLHPIGRTGSPEDIGDAAVFLASNSSSFVTGQVLIVDGGRTTKLPLPF